jgi:hypothetical protein
MKEKFNEWMRKSKPRITRPDKYSNTITTISNHFRKSIGKDINLYEIHNIRELITLKDEYFSYDKFYSRNKIGNNMYSRSLDLYIEFLESKYRVNE